MVTVAVAVTTAVVAFGLTRDAVRLLQHVHKTGVADLRYSYYYRY
jgi:hypothetical protein